MLTPEQRAARRGFIGGSDVAAILGISPWKNAYDVWLDKTADTEPDELEGDHIVFGNLMEPVLREEFARRTGKQVAVHADPFFSKRYRWACANIDGSIVGENAGLEIKTASEYTLEQWGEEGTDAVPAYYLTQGLHYIAVMGWDRIYFAVLIGGNKFKTYTVERDDDAIAMVMEVEQRFWIDNVEARVAPPMALEQLTSAWSKTSGNVVDATDGIATAVENLKVIKKQIDELEESRKGMERDIKEFIADADELQSQGKKICTWRFNKSSLKFSAKKLEEALPDIHSQFVVETPGPRVFKLY